MQNLDLRVQQFECCLNCLLVFNCLPRYVVYFGKSSAVIQRSSGWEAIRRGAVADQTLTQTYYFVPSKNLAGEVIPWTPLGWHLGPVGDLS